MSKYEHLVLPGLDYYFYLESAILESVWYDKRLTNHNILSGIVGSGFHQDNNM